MKVTIKWKKKPDTQTVLTTQLTYVNCNHGKTDSNQLSYSKIKCSTLEMPGVSWHTHTLCSQFRQHKYQVIIEIWIFIKLFQFLKCPVKENKLKMQHKKATSMN